MERMNPLDRRRFLQNSALALGVTSILSPSTTQADHHHGQSYYEWRRYHIADEAGHGVVSRFLEKAAIPALNRLGVSKVGVFSLMESDTPHDLFVLTTAPSLEALFALPASLAEDGEFLRMAEEYLSTEKKTPAYTRVESSVFRAFSGYPGLKTPRKGDRIFELRTYESHNELKAILKIQMFNEAELDIFRKVGLDGVFYGEALVAPNLPQLTYMLAYKDMEEREANWKKFLTHPDWQVLKKDERFKDTVSKITATYLKPVPFSQV